MQLDAAQQEVLAFEATAMLNRLQCISERQQRLLAQLCSPAAAPSGVHPNPELVRLVILQAASLTGQLHVGAQFSDRAVGKALHYSVMWPDTAQRLTLMMHNRAHIQMGLV